MKLIDKLKQIVSSRNNIWRKAFSASFLFHMTAVLTVGAMAAGFHQEIQRPPEQFIDVNLADTPEEIAKAEAQKSPLGQLRQMVDSVTKPAEKTQENTAKSNSPANNSDAPADKSDADDTGGMSSPDGILPSGTQGQGSQDGAQSNLTPGGGSGDAAPSEEANSGGGEAAESGGGNSDGGNEGGGQTESVDSLKARFASAVESNKQYPHFAVRMNQQGTVYVTVTLGADGSLLGASVSGSVNGNLDKAALNAVYASTPFSHGVGSSVTMTVPVSFYLN